ncbi:MAG: resolvase [Halothiobacillus sp. 14-56-357]|nr:MAG: resolvase [Halothiobacillus sp. 14-56-357]OZB78229.1 MAG: resolvase [Halothiobacillus sp. 13-55-115]
MFWNPWGVRRHAHLALVHTSIEHSRDWCRSLLILNCQELAAQQPLRPINWCSRLLKMTFEGLITYVQKTVVCLRE